MAILWLELKSSQVIYSHIIVQLTPQGCSLERERKNITYALQTTFTYRSDKIKSIRQHKNILLS